MLQNWEGPEDGYVVIDALDAARNFGTHICLSTANLSRPFLALGGRWRVIASVRKYDLRYGMEWRKSVCGNSTGTGIPRCRVQQRPSCGDSHLVSGRDRRRRGTPSPPESISRRERPDPVRELLRTIFNLHLLSQLIEDGASSDALTHIRTQLDLLDRWWQHRVIRSDRKHDSRARALGLLLEGMIEARSLQIARDWLRANPALDLDVLSDLESHGVLRATDTSEVAPSGDRIQFAHHILFDYAVARITFSRGFDAAIVIGRFAKDRDLVLVLRPSLNLICLDTWSLGGSRDAF